MAQYLPPRRIKRAGAGSVPPPTFRVTDFKAVGLATLDPTRLTVIAGANSSGKSSLVQAALFFAQSFGRRQTVINGDLVRLGEPTDLVRDGASEIALEFEYEGRGAIAEGDSPPAHCAMRISLAPRGERLVPVRFTLYKDECLILEAVEASDAATLPAGADEVALRLQNPDDLGLPTHSYLTFTGLTPSRLIFKVSLDALERGFEDLLQLTREGFPSAIETVTRLARLLNPNQTSDGLRERLARFRHRAGRSMPANPAMELTDPEKQQLFQAWIESEAPDGWASESVGRFGRTRISNSALLDATDDKPESYVQALWSLGVGVDRMDALARALLYLGPLREDPRIAYPLGHTVRNLPVGEKGEFTAAYLESNKTQRVGFVPPNGRSTITKGLWLAVSEWCSYLGIAEKVSVKTQGKMGHTVGLEVGGRERDPTAIGVGASQLLPVVVLVLGAAQGSVVFLEQPELHLHPKVQSRLADFLAFARPDIRLVVETHSEYLITRLRLRAAEGSLATKDLAMLFATQRVSRADEAGVPSRGDFTEFERLNISSLGDFDVWPSDFFDTLTGDMLEIARAIDLRLGGGSPGSLG